jgi:hypothetical protein
MENATATFYYVIRNVLTFLFNSKILRFVILLTIKTNIENNLKWPLELFIINFELCFLSRMTCSEAVKC